MVRWRNLGLLAAGVILIAGLVLWIAFPDPGALLLTNWIITPISVLAAAFANATAVGGGFLFVPVFIFFFGLPATSALKLSLSTQAFGMTSGALGWSGKYIHLQLLGLACAGSLAGMVAGTYWLVVPNDKIKLLFGWVSLLIGLAVILEMRYGGKYHEHEPKNDTLAKRLLFVLLCFPGGLITAWTSIGIGEVVALYMLFVYRMQIEAAVATGVAALAANSILGLAMHTHLGGIEWQYLIFTAPGVIVGGRLGAQAGRWIEARMRRRAHREAPALSMNHSPLKWTFVVVVLLDGLVMLIQSYGMR